MIVGWTESEMTGCAMKADGSLRILSRVSASSFSLAFGTDHDAVAAGRAGWLDDVALEIVDHLLAHFRIAQQVGLDDR